MAFGDTADPGVVPPPSALAIDPAPAFSWALGLISESVPRENGDGLRAEEVDDGDRTGMPIPTPGSQLLCIATSAFIGQMRHSLSAGLEG